MQERFLYVIIGLILLLLVYLLWRLNRLEQLLNRYKFKNQEGIGALSRTKNPLFLILAIVQLCYFMIEWWQKGFEVTDIYRAVVLIGLPLYIYFSQNKDN